MASGKSDAEHDGTGDAPENDLRAQLGRHPGGGKSDDYGIVTGKHEVDHDHLCERKQLGIHCLDRLSCWRLIASVRQSRGARRAGAALGQRGAKLGPISGSRR